MKERKPDALLLQYLDLKDPTKAWDHKWFIPSWDEGDPTPLDGEPIKVGKDETVLGTYKVVPFWTRNPREGIIVEQELFDKVVEALKVGGNEELLAALKQISGNGMRS